jgi:hypothetical protein
MTWEGRVTGGLKEEVLGRIKLLLVLARRVFLAFSGPVGTHGLIFVRSKTIYLCGNGASSSTRGGVGAIFVAPKSRTSVPPLTQRPGKGICTLCILYTLCHFTTMNNMDRIEKHCGQQFLYRFVCIRCRRNVFTQPLPNNAQTHRQQASFYF